MKDKNCCGETLRALNEALKRRDCGWTPRGELPAVLWMVVVAGAVMSLSSSFFFIESAPTRSWFCFWRRSWGW